MFSPGHIFIGPVPKRRPLLSSASVAVEYDAAGPQGVGDIYIGGVFAGRSGNLSELYSDDAALVEFVPSGARPETETHASTVKINWAGGGSAVNHYRIEEAIDGGSFAEIATIRESGRRHYVHETGSRADEASVQLRVVAVGKNGQESTSTADAVLIVRHPDGPDVTFGAVTAGQVTVSAA